MKNVKWFLSGGVGSGKESVTVSGVFEEYHRGLKKMYGEDYCVIPYKKSEREKYLAVINKFINSASQKSIEELSQQI